MIEPPSISDELLVAVEEGIMTLTLNRPGQRNAMTLEIATGIAKALHQLDERPDISAAVVTGTGGTFCAGADLKRLLAGESAHVAGRGFGGLVEAPPRKPLVAAVEGWALGGGFELVLACDLVVAAEGARFGVPEVTRGLVARGGGAVRLPRRLPRAVALEMLLTGQPIDAQRAAAHGLVNRVVPNGTALGAARGLATTIATNAPLAVAASKALVVDSADWPENELFVRQTSYTNPVFASVDAREGAAAFAEGRMPRWQGR